MGRRSKGPHLWFRPDDRRYVILDAGRQVSLGAITQLEAEKALAEYIGLKHRSLIGSTKRDPERIPIADVLALYATDVAPGTAHPDEIGRRLRRVLDFFGERNLSEINGALCRQYAKKVGADQAARSDLSYLRAAINHHRQEGLHDRVVSVWMPAKSPPRERWLTRDEAAKLIWTAWRHRESQNGHKTDRRTRKHVARWMVTARYMGSRASVICSASIEPARPAGRAWIDLTTGVFYGRPEGQRETKKRRQTVRVPPALLAHMRRWRALGQRHVVEWTGQPVASIKKAHAAAVRDAGLDADVTPHTWRHTLATWLMKGGANPWKASEFLGMTVATLTRVYGHHHPENSEDVHRALRRK